MPETDKEKKAKKEAVRPARIGVDPNLPKPNITKKTGYGESTASTKDRELKMYENPDYLIQNKIGRTGYWNAFQNYLKDYKLPTGESYIGNEAANVNLANDYTNLAISDYNKSLLEKYKDKPEVVKKMSISLDDVEQVQKYYNQGDPNVKVDRIVGGETSQFRYPSAAFVDVDKAKEGEFIPVMYGGKQYVVPAASYNRGITSQDFIKYDPSIHQNINPDYVKATNSISTVRSGRGFVIPEPAPTGITPVTTGATTPSSTTTANATAAATATPGATTTVGATTTPSVSSKSVKPVAPKITTSPTGEIIYEGMDDPKYDAIKKENARKRAMSTETTPAPTVLPTSEEKAPVTIPQNKAKGGSIMAPKMKKYKNGTGPDGLTDQQRNEKYGINNSGVVQVSSGQGQTNTGNVPLTQEQVNAKNKKNNALAAQLGSAAMSIGNQLNQQPIDYSASEKQRQNADIANVGIDQTLSAVNPYYGLAKGASGILGSMTAKDKYGEAKSGVNAAINEITAMPTERIASEAAKGNALGVLREASGWGKIGRAGMQIIGKGDETKGFFGGVNKALGTTDRKKAGEKYMAEQLAEAKSKDTAYKQEQAVANRDANVLEGAQVQGLYDLSNPEYDENRQLILKPGYAKGGVIGAAKMRYAKGGTIVGKGGPKDDAILTKANKEGIEPGSFIVPAENNEKAKGIRAALFGNKNQIAKFKKGGEMESNVAVSNEEHLFTPKERKKIVNYLGEEILEELAPNAEENNESENDKAMGGMIKRADGSYSKRGLWDNIRDAAGSGKKPTAEMLKQEKNIKAGYYNGGIMPEGIASQKRTEQIQDSYKSGGYVVQRSSDREGKTHKVTGPDGTVKYFGDPNLGQHPKDPARKEAFYARHKENLDNNPHFRAYARETWAEGGTTGTMTDRTNMAEYKDGGLTKSKAKIMLHEGMANGKPITEQQRKYFGWVAGGSKESKMDGGKIMAPKMKGYAAGGDVEGTNDGTNPSNLKIAARKNSTGVAEFDKEIDNISKKVYTSAAQLEADAKKLEAIQDKYNAIYGKNSLEISNARQGLFKIKPEVEKKYASIKKDVENSDVVKKGIEKLKSLGASEKDINDYKKEIADKKINVGYGAGSTTYGDVTDKYVKSVGTKESKRSAEESKKSDIDLLKKDASKLYGEKYTESKAKLDDINKNPQNYTVDQINEVKNNYELYKRKLNDVSDAVSEGGLKLVRERDLYKDLAKKEGISVKGADKITPTTSTAKAKESESAKKLPVDVKAESNKTYEELITPPTTWKGTKEEYKTAADKAITEGKVVPKGGVTTTATTKSVKAPSVKDGKKGEKVTESLRFVPEMASESEGEGVIVPGDNLSPNERVALTAKEKIDAENAKKLNESAMAYQAANPTSPAAPRKGLADYVKNIDPGAAFSAYQIGQGSKLLKSGQRPTDVSKIDPAWNASVERAQREAAFGYTPEERAALEQQRINALNDARFAGKNLAGGSAVAAFQQERQAINQGWTNALQLKSADQQLRMQKQQYADQAVRERAAFLDSQRRRAFGDAMDTYNVNQESGSALVGAGVRNAIGAFRYQKELDAQERAAKMAGAPIKTD